MINDDIGFGIIAMGVLVLIVLSLRHFIYRYKTGTLGKVFRSREIPPKFFDTMGVEISACSHLSLHKFKNGWCVWCGKSFIDLSIKHQDQVKGSNSFSPQKLKDIPLPDLNSPTTATANVSTFPDLPEPEYPELIKNEIKIPTMDLHNAQAYCLKCKTKVPVLDPMYSNEETKRGIRRYLKGLCSICESRISAIVKKGDGQ